MCGVLNVLAQVAMVAAVLGAIYAGQIKITLQRASARSEKNNKSLPTAFALLARGPLPTRGILSALVAVALASWVVGYIAC